MPEKEKPLAKKFIEEYSWVDPWPPIHNLSMIMAANERTTEKYFYFYKEKVAFPFMNIIKKTDSIMFASLDKFTSMAKETFKDYWKNPKKIKEIMDEYNKHDSALNEIYKNLTYNNLDKTDINELIKESRKADVAAWMADGRSMCSIIFDKDLCLELIKTLKIKISESRLEEVWDTATIPNSDSFEKRRLLYYLGLLKKNLSEDEIAEKCDYFYGGFYDVPNLEETKKKLKEGYKPYKENENLIDLTFEQSEKEKIERNENFDRFFSTLNEGEKKLVAYIQFIMEFRDIRKDVYGKVLSVRYRVARKMFKEAGIPEEYIVYYTCLEMAKGPDYLKKNKKKIMSRENGFSALMHSDNRIEFQEGYYNENEKLMDEFYLEKNKSHIKENEIKGQPACSGKVIGNVKIIKNVSKDYGKFNRGDILVTGMTRVEFVPLMKKASAIITDEGGITCHAAIISRELKIPCIIGTRIATKVLKDNDLVEVDAEKGIVRILKKVQN